jgi:hypothetical protein
LEVAPDFVFEVCEWLRVLVDHFQDVLSEVHPVRVPSCVSRDLECSFELG